MYKYAFFAMLSLGLIAACESKIDDLESTKQQSSVATTELDGVVTGTISPSATTNQVLVASASSRVADASVTFPPGALAIATEVSLGEAADKSTTILAELGVTNAVKAAEPVYVGPPSGTAPGLLKPLTIQLPLPLDAAGTTLAPASSKLVLIYTIYDNGWKSGMIPVTSANLIGAFLKQAMNGFGYFQIVYLAATVEEKAAAASTVIPSLEGEDPVVQEELPADENPVTDNAISCSGDASGSLAGTYAYVKGCRSYKRNTNGSNLNCAYAVDSLMSVGVNGDGAISLVNANAVKSTGVLLPGYPLAFADSVTVRWASPDAASTSRTEVDMGFDEISEDPLVNNGLKINFYTDGTVSGTCFFDFVSAL